MSITPQQQYQLTAKIHSLLSQINQKYGLSIEVESDYCYYIPRFIELGGGKLKMNDSEEVVYTNYCYITETGVKKQRIDIKVDNSYVSAIQSSQIRQILVSLQEVLGENPELNHYKNTGELVITPGCDELEAMQEDENYNGYCRAYQELLPKSQAEALCQKWLDGLNPLFNRDPETVLQELLEILEKLVDKKIKKY